ncbi:hypothetical protein MUK51_11015 [Sphingobacterium faecium]|uniref:hypothetical protein n=1 Tax=Sphingobacterium TaxID=28453 RepID=UPI0004E5F666|nr:MULTISPECIES: hypothetical protein [Sphingobacterium]MBB2951978.1 hypothetical protein [Sphingobacterium sp. JUb56]UXD67758.1 hypothetical protein MUK51_11015 [Sphingobacterium faecium]CDS94500.1 hypothetical protein BN1088_1431983 [Sphingobacterium sp. PM2-P1-29]
MGLIGVKRTGTQGFQKVVFENVIDTLPAGLMLEVAKANYPDGYVPEGSLVGRDPATGIGKVLTAVDGAIKPIGFTHRASEVVDGGNTNANGVVISGTVRIKALPAALQAIIEDLRTALPRFTFV